MLVERTVREGIASSVHRFARSQPTAVALVDGQRVVDYQELSALVKERAASWELAPRSLVVLGGTSSLGFVVAYLSLLEAGHVALLGGDRCAQLAGAWRPAAVAMADSEGTNVERFDAETHELHPDLALLLSTSGSTGSPKLVRLSYKNVASNAGAIAEYLSLTQGDRAITSLPLHYCYGLSVLHSHLVVGASVVLTNASVVDPCFRYSLEHFEVTNFAGVPHTFELLDRSRFDELTLPHLRLLTVAGGRLAPDRVQSWAHRLDQRGARLFVMYGQTEATARMAYLPPELAATCPSAIGVPVPGGAIELRPHPAVADCDVGEIVYTGPNVMMGYADQPSQLADGHTLTELRTGDLARLRPEGVYEIVGRAARFVKPFGLRIDLDHVERELIRSGVASASEIAVVGDDTRLVVATQAAAAGLGALRASIVELTNLPDRCVHVVHCDELPRTASGKVDATALLASATEAEIAVESGPVATHGTQTVAAMFAEILGRADVRDTDTFISLGGDSLSYIECGLQLEGIIGRLPDDWHVTAVADLECLNAGTTPSRLVRLDITVLMRAFSICAVVCTHMGLYRFPGGAHLLLAVVGYNFARFLLAAETGRARLLAGLRTAARVAIPTSVWIGVNMLIAGGYSFGALALVNNYTGSSYRREGRWQYWFFEVFVQLLLVTSVLMAVPLVRRLERRLPFLFPLVLLAPLLMFRFRSWELGDHYNYLFRTHTVAWFFVLGWATQRADRVWKRALLSALAIAVVPDFFGRSQREVFIVVGLIALAWLPVIPVPRILVRPMSALASASMWIFLVHWQLFPPLDELLKREVAFALTIASGVAVWWISLRALVLLRAVPAMVADRFYSQVKPSSGALATGSIR
ncbi:MAG: AMP-binding protein [Ilumatobacteraceae bacterium]